MNSFFQKKNERNIFIFLFLERLLHQIIIQIIAVYSMVPSSKRCCKALQSVMRQNGMPRWMCGYGGVLPSVYAGVPSSGSPVSPHFTWELLEEKKGMRRHKG
jgi:hypothetical protein